MTKLSTKVSHAIKESTVILPGTQALLGFQLVAIFSDGFGRLPHAFQLLHFVSLLCVVLATLLIIGTVSYHRIVESEEDTPRFSTYMARMQLQAMGALGAGLATDLAVVTEAITHSLALDIFVSACAVAAMLVLWLAIPLWHRGR